MLLLLLLLLLLVPLLLPPAGGAVGRASALVTLSVRLLGRSCSKLT